MAISKARATDDGVQQSLEETAQISGFVEGFACACAQLQNMHGDDSLSAELLSLLGRFDINVIHPNDAEILVASGIYGHVSSCWAHQKAAKQRKKKR